MGRDEQNIEKSRRGCNRHFKDSFMAKGWDIRECVKFPTGVDPGKERDRGAPGICAWQTDKIPTEDKMATYSIENEAIFFACQHTLGKYGDELAGFLSEQLQTRAKSPSDVFGEACREKAKCLDRKYSLSIEKRSAIAQEQAIKKNMTKSKRNKTNVNKKKKSTKKLEKEDVVETVEL